MFTKADAGITRLANTIIVVAIVAIGGLAMVKNGQHGPQDGRSAGKLLTPAEAPAAVAQLPEVVVRAPRIEPQGRHQGD
jgi:hypothetical protein